MTVPALSDHRKGLLITSVGGLVLSFDIPLIRLADGNVWSVLGVRSLSTFVAALVVWSLIRLLTRARPPLVPGRAGVVCGILYGVVSMTFLGAVYHTATANVVFIVAFTPMVAALLSWIFLKERPGASTLVTMAIMVFGVGLIVHDGMASGQVFGDLLAAMSALTLGAAITIGRASRSEMGFVPLMATLLPAVIGLSIALPDSFSIGHPGWTLFGGGVMMPLAFWCLATGPRYLSAPEVGMFYLLETVLAPIWVWLIFTETPSNQTLIGGSILILALIGHSAWQMRTKQASAA